ncbi:MAG TPA: UDP-3-O-acyl-N-acetylglucosamine deacetylase [Leptolyngbyaceae cyanobacterium]
MSQTSTEQSTAKVFAVDLETPQKTLAQAVSREGVGLHSGQLTRVTLKPAQADQSRVFVRTDLPGQPAIAARPDAVHQTQLSTELVNGEASVRTVEHLLAALTGMGIDNVHIEINGPEVPLLDGSAKEWVEAVLEGGVTTQAAPKRAFQVNAPVTVYDGDAFVAALPSPESRFTYGIDFEVPAIGNQWHSWLGNATANDFAETVAPARTFGLAHQIEYLRSQGLIKGGSLDNALVCGQEGWLNPPLRFDNEPARHKLLDLIGDISLLGRVPLGHLVAFKASHRLHVQLAQTLQEILSPGA